MYNVNDELWKTLSVSVYNVCKDSGIRNVHDAVRRGICGDGAGVQDIQTVLVRFERLMRMPEEQKVCLRLPGSADRLYQTPDFCKNGR